MLYHESPRLRANRNIEDMALYADYEMNHG